MAARIFSMHEVVLERHLPGLLTINQRPTRDVRAFWWHTHAALTIGNGGVIEEGGAITKLVWNGKDCGLTTQLADEAIRQLEAYFAREITAFDLPLAPRGTTI